MRSSFNSQLLLLLLLLRAKSYIFRELVPVQLQTLLSLVSVTDKNSQNNSRVIFLAIQEYISLNGHDLITYRTTSGYNTVYRMYHMCTCHNYTLGHTITQNQMHCVKWRIFMVSIAFRIIENIQIILPSRIMNNNMNLSSTPI